MITFTYIYQEQSKEEWNVSSLSVTSLFGDHKLILWDYNQKLVFCVELKFKPLS